MARRASRRHRANERDHPIAAPYIRRGLAYFDVLDEDALLKLEAQVDWIFEEVGIEFRDDDHALDVWRHAGARIIERRVFADAAMIRALCAKAPSVFEQKARNDARSVKIGDGYQVFAAVYGPPFVRDQKRGRRYGDYQSFGELVKLSFMLPHIHHTGLMITEPVDLPVNKRHLDCVLAHMLYSDKPHLGAITEKSRAQDSVEMARILHGADFDRHCVIMGNVNTNSPLMVDRVVTEAIEVYCGSGQGIVVAPFILSGAMGPVTTAGSITQAMAEAMMCCAYSQLICAGAPFVMGNFLSSMSLKSGAPTFGMPEPTLSNYVIGQLARRAKLPLRCGGSLTASKIADAQAAAESADSMHSTALAGANFVLHAAGWLEGGLCTGYEKLLIDHDRLGGYAKLLAGLDVSENALAQDALGAVEPAGHYLGSDHTMANYQSAFYEPVLSDSENVESWEERGALDMQARAAAKWQEMLDAYEKPPIDAGVEEALQDFVARRKSEMDDAWY